MGKIFKKKVNVDAAVEAKRASKRKAEEPPKEEVEEEVDEDSVEEDSESDGDVENAGQSNETEEVEDEEDVDDEDEFEDEDEDEDDEEDEDEDEDEEGGKKEKKVDYSDFDIEAFPLEDKDKDGLIDMLTQIFLRTSIDCSVIADEMIRISPFGNVLGPAEDETVEDTANLVFSVVTCLDVNLTKEEPSAFATSIYNFVKDRANSKAVTAVRTAIEELGKERFGFLINERLLDFPSKAVRQCFESLKVDLAGMKKPFNKVLYIHKIRYADLEKDKISVPSAKKKKKLGKAAKKRLATDILANCSLVFESVEDEDLYKLEEGSITYFDYPVYGDVETGSKFHVTEKDGKKLKPFRRAALMDKKRFNAFINHLARTEY